MFDGIGGFPLAAQRCGIKTIWASEIEPNCIAITKRHFPDVQHLGSITEIDGGKIPPVDIISFGSPCQDLSVGGQQKGLEGERSGLFMEAVRIIYEMRESTNGAYPTFIIWENVPGAFNSNRGNDFRTVLEKITKTNISMPSSGKWATAGMARGCAGGANIAWRQLDSQFWGVPQRRKRIFLVGDFRGQRAPEILFKCESLLGYSSKSRAKGKEIAANLGGGFETSSGGGVISVANQETVVDFGRNGDRIRINATKSATITASDGGGGTATGLYLLPHLYPINDGVINGKANGLGIGDNGEPAPTLTGRDRHAIAFFEAYQHHGWRKSEKAGTITAGQNTCVRGDTPLVMEQHIYENHSHAGYKEGCGTLRASGGDIAGGSENLVVLIERAKLFVKYILRKLTPLECERLQGYPDDWTRYTDTGKEIKDTPRYVALGNSLAVPCAERVFKGIVAVMVGSE